MDRFKIAAAAAAGLMASMTFAASAASAGTSPDGLSFAVTVSKNGGAPFKDCFSFDADGRLVVSGLRKFGSLVYADHAYGTDVSWLSTAPPGFVARFGAGMMFAGQVNNGDLAATGLSTPDYIYVITGAPVASCTTPGAFGPSGWRSAR